jgi:hypothetical protein
VVDETNVQVCGPLSRHSVARRWRSAPSAAPIAISDVDLLGDPNGFSLMSENAKVGRHTTQRIKEEVP